MPRMQILTPQEYAVFETPPVFTNIQRQRFFDLSPNLLNLLTTFRTPTNQMGFVLTLGYFKATGRFFARQFHPTDADYVSRQLGFLPGVFDLSTYDEGTSRRHCQMILDDLGFGPFDAEAKRHLKKEIRTMVCSQVRPKVILLHALDILARRKTEIPTAYMLTDLIASEIRAHKRTLTKVISALMTPELRELLSALLEKPEGSVEEAPQVQRFKLTLLVKISQSTRPKKIFATLEDWQVLHGLYHKLTPVIAELELTHEGLRYYANSVIKSRAFQISQRTDEDRHLHRVCFIAHQFYRLQDTLIEILLTVVQNALNTCQRVHKEQYYATRIEQHRAVRDFVDCVDDGAISPLNAIEAIAFSSEMSDAEKVQCIQDVLRDKSPQRDTAKKQLTAIKAARRLLL